MKENRDNRYHGRISSATKARWEAASKQQGYRTLSLFIEEAVEEKIASAARDAGRSEADESPLGGAVVAVDTEAASPVVPGETLGDGTTVVHDVASFEKTLPKDVAPTLPKECANQRFHRKGIYCKTCRTVVGSTVKR